MLDTNRGPLPTAQADKEAADAAERARISQPEDIARAAEEIDAGSPSYDAAASSGVTGTVNMEEGELGAADTADATVKEAGRAATTPGLGGLLRRRTPAPDTKVGITQAAPADGQADDGTTSDGFLVDQIKQGDLDSRNVRVERIYALRSKEYAVYRADGIWVEFADKPDKEKDQRKAVLSIGEARADLASLLLGWKPKRQQVYECKIAMALQLALDDQVQAAQKTIDAARTDALNERAAAGRLQYLASAVAACAVLGLLLVGLGYLWPPSDKSPINFWLAGQAGLAGAAFSIVLAIKGRTVALDTDLTGNASDGLLRLAIGMVSGFLLLLFLTSKVVPKFAFGDATFSPGDLTTQSVVVLGFVAGFMERMVPDLLDKAQPKSLGAPSHEAA